MGRRRPTTSSATSLIRIKPGLLVALALLFAGCGSSDDQDTPVVEPEPEYASVLTSQSSTLAAEDLALNSASEQLDADPDAVLSFRSQESGSWLLVVGFGGTTNFAAWMEMVDDRWIVRNLQGATGDSLVFPQAPCDIRGAFTYNVCKDEERVEQIR